MKKLFLFFTCVLMTLTLTACGGSGTKSSGAGSKTASANKVSAPVNKKALVAYFSCSGNTKALAETTAAALSADLYEIRPQVPYTSQDLNYNEAGTRATAEQKDDSARPALADTNASIGDYDIIVLAYPIWWGQAPRILDTFVESYDFSGKTIIPICTSGGSGLGSSADYLKTRMKGNADWKEGKEFGSRASKDEVQSWLAGLGL